jgi:hypothetical protein
MACQTQLILESAQQPAAATAGPPPLSELSTRSTVPVIPYRTTPSGCGTTPARTTSCASSRSAPAARAFAARPRNTAPWRSRKRTPPPAGSSVKAPRRASTGRMAVAGDPVGGGMAAALTLMATDRADVRFVHTKATRAAIARAAALFRNAFDGQRGTECQTS